MVDRDPTHLRRVSGSLLAVVAATATALAGPAAASGSYFLSKKQAESLTRRHLHYTVGYHYTVADCRPQGRSKPKRGYVYHRWVCAFAAGDSRYEPSCYGSALVRGSSDPDSFYYRVLHHDGKCPLGWDN